MGSNVSWSLTLPAKSIAKCISGTKCWVSGGKYGVPNPTEMSWIQSPEFDFTYFINDPLFSFWVNSQNVLGTVGINVQLSTDLGQSW